MHLCYQLIESCTNQTLGHQDAVHWKYDDIFETDELEDMTNFKRRMTRKPQLKNINSLINLPFCSILFDCPEIILIVIWWFLFINLNSAVNLNVVY